MLLPPPDSTSTLECPQCKRSSESKVTYTCTVPGCLAIRFCCPACICEHMGQHVRERDDRIVTLTRERDEEREHRASCLSLCMRNDALEEDLRSLRAQLADRPAGLYFSEYKAAIERADKAEARANYNHKQIKAVRINCECENARLTAELASAQAEVKQLRNRLQFDPGGSDKIDELEQAMQFIKHNLAEERAGNNSRQRSIEILGKAIGEIIPEFRASGTGEEHSAACAAALINKWRGICIEVERLDDEIRRLNDECINQEFIANDWRERFDKMCDVLHASEAESERLRDSIKMEQERHEREHAHMKATITHLVDRASRVEELKVCAPFAIAARKPGVKP